MPVTARSRVVAKLIPRWPSSISEGLAINVARSGTALTISWDISGLAVSASPLSTWKIPMLEADGTTYKLVTLASGLSVTHTHLLAQISDMSADAAAFCGALNNAAMRTALGLGSAALQAVAAFAPSSSSFLVLGADATLTSERVLTAGTGITLTDAGAGLALTVRVTANGVSNALLRQSAALSVVGNATNATADVADIAAGSDGHVLRRSGTAIAFGAVATAGITDAAVTLAKMADIATASIVGRATAGTGVPEALTGAQVATLTGAAVGPGSSTDNAIVRFDLATGKLVQNSLVTIDDSGNVAGIPIISRTGGTALQGTNTNDDVGAGYVGEIIEQEVLSGSAVSLVTTTVTNIASLALTAGDWDVWANIWFAPAGTTTLTTLVAAISTASAALPTAPGKGAYVFNQHTSYPTGLTQGFYVGARRVKLSGAATVYLCGYAIFAVSTMQAYGYIGARRRR